MSIVGRLGAIQREQAGAVHAVQVRAAGMSRAQVARLVSSGLWAKPHPGVYVASGAPVTFETRCFAAFLAVRYAGRDGPRRVAVSGHSAAWLLGLDVPTPAAVGLTVPVEDSAPRLRGVTVTRARTWPRRVFVLNGGLVVTALADTIVDVAFGLPPERLHAVVQEAAFGRPGLPREVLAACRRGRHGSAAARRAAALVLAGVDSSLHARGVVLAREAGLPPPACGVEVATGAGPSDCVFTLPGAAGSPRGLVVEWDGDAHRVDRRTFLHDREKDRLVRRAGYVVLRYTAAQVARDGLVAADLRAEWAAVARRSVQRGAGARAS